MDSKTSQSRHQPADYVDKVSDAFYNADRDLLYNYRLQVYTLHCRSTRQSLKYTNNLRSLELKLTE